VNVEENIVWRRSATQKMSGCVDRQDLNSSVVRNRDKHDSECYRQPRAMSKALSEVGIVDLLVRYLVPAKAKAAASSRCSWRQLVCIYDKITQCHLISYIQYSFWGMSK